MSTNNEPRKGGTRTVTQAEGEKLEREWADKMSRGIINQPAPVTKQEESANAD